MYIIDVYLLCTVDKCYYIAPWDNTININQQVTLYLANVTIQEVNNQRLSFICTYSTID